MEQELKIHLYTITSSNSPLIEMHIDHAGEKFMLDVVYLSDIESFLYAVLILLQAGSSSRVNLRWFNDQDYEYLWELEATPMAPWVGKPVTVTLSVPENDHPRSTASYDPVQLAQEVVRAYRSLVADFEGDIKEHSSHAARLMLSIELLEEVIEEAKSGRRRYNEHRA